MIFGPFRASFGTNAESHEQYSVLAGSPLSHKAIIDSIKSRCAKQSLRLFPYLPSAHDAEAIILAATRVRLIPIVSWFVTTYQSGIFACRHNIVSFCIVLFENSFPCFCHTFFYI